MISGQRFQPYPSAFQSHRLDSGKIEIVALHTVAGAGNQHRVDNVINIIEAAQLLAVAEDVDFFGVDGLLDENTIIYSSPFSRCKKTAEIAN